MGPWSNDQAVMVVNYKPLRAPDRAPDYMFQDGKVKTTWNATAPTMCHVTGIVRKWTVNGVVAKTEKLPVNYTGDVVVPPVGNVGDNVGVSYAWETWADVYVYWVYKAQPIWGEFTPEAKFVKQAFTGPEVVDFNPKAPG